MQMTLQDEHNITPSSIQTMSLTADCDLIMNFTVSNLQIELLCSYSGRKWPFNWLTEHKEEKRKCNYSQDALLSTTFLQLKIFP